MRTSEAIDQLATALAAAQAEMPNASLNRANPFYNSRYADLSAIREASLPALTKHGLSIVQTPYLTDEGLILMSRLLHKSGQWIEGEWPIPHGTPQAMGSQLTYGRRYLWSGQAGVTADDDDDANAAETAAKAKPKVKGVAEVGLETKTLGKRESRPIYNALVIELRDFTNKPALTKWAMENTDRIHSMHADFQKYFLNDYKGRLTAIAEGADEAGNEVKDIDAPPSAETPPTIGDAIDDQIPAEGGGSEAAS